MKKYIAAIISCLALSAAAQTDRMLTECELQMSLGTCAPYEDSRPPRPPGSRVWVSGQGGSGWHAAETYDFLRSHGKGMCAAAARACIADASGRVCGLSVMLWGGR